MDTATEQAAKKSGLDYDCTVFLECPPGGTPVPLRHHRVHSRAEHASLVEQVRSRKNYLYHATVVKQGSKFYAYPPYIIDWDSVPEHPTEVKKTQEQKERPRDPRRWDGGLSCPFCGQAVSSTPGRTLHVKANHPERLDEYQKLLAQKETPRPDELDDEDDVVSRLAESDGGGGLKCPFCASKVSSTSGRTLHVKASHPEKLGQYQQMLVDGQLV